MADIISNPTRSETDEQLAELCRKGDHGAFHELMDRYLKPIFNFVRQYSKDSEDTDDITQDAFFKVWRNIGQYKKGRAFKPWLYTIARNTALDYLKKKRSVSFSNLDDNESDIAFADTLADNEPLPTELFDRAALTKDMEKKLEKLQPDYRSVIILHYNEDMTFEEIATVVNRPMNTVKSWHRRALLRLREISKDLSHHL